MHCFSESKKFKQKTFQKMFSIYHFPVLPGLLLLSLILKHACIVIQYSFCMQIAEQLYQRSSHIYSALNMYKKRNYGEQAISSLEW